MKFKQKLILMLLIMTLVFVSVVSAESYKVGDITKGDILKFKSEHAGENITYPEDIFKYLGYDSGHYRFEVLQDATDVVADFNFEVITHEKEIESGSSNNNGEAGTESGGVSTWQGLEWGKQLWTNFSEGHFHYAIRLQADRFDRENTITVVDTANKPLQLKAQPYVVGYKANGDTISISDVVNIESKLIERDKGFVIQFDPIEGVAAYDIIYYTQYDIELTNNYIAKQNKREIVGGGSIAADKIEQDNKGEVEPEEPICPPCPECNEKDQQIKDLEKDNQNLQDKIKELENVKPIIIEKEVIKEVEVEKPIYITEIQIQEVIKEVVKEVEVEKPIYITEIQIEEIIKEVIKEVEVEKPIYITDTQIKEIIKEVECGGRHGIKKPSNAAQHGVKIDYGNGDKVETHHILPKTGESPIVYSILAGLLIVGIGIVIRKQ